MHKIRHSLHLQRLQPATAPPDDWDNALMSDSTAPTEVFDVIVVGGGHAGCEAAITAARLGLNTALFTLNLDRIAWQPCNPAVGGPAKS